MRYRLTREAGAVVDATRNSIRGIVHATRTERAFRQHLVAAGVLVPTAFALPATAAETALLLGATGITLAVELLNTAIERTVDRISPDRHVLAGQAKDAASGAVAVCLLVTGLVWAVVVARIVREAAWPGAGS